MKLKYFFFVTLATLWTSHSFSQFKNKDLPEIESFMEARGWCNPYFFYLKKYSENEKDPKSIIKELGVEASIEQYVEVISRVLFSGTDQEKEDLGPMRESITGEVDRCLMDYVQLGTYIRSLKTINSYYYRLELLYRSLTKDSFYDHYLDKKGKKLSSSKVAYDYGKVLIVVMDTIYYLDKISFELESVLSFYRDNRLFYEQSYSESLYGHYQSYAKGWIKGVAVQAKKVKSLRRNLHLNFKGVFLQGNTKLPWMIHVNDLRVYLNQHWKFLKSSCCQSESLFTGVNPLNKVKGFKQSFQKVIDYLKSEKIKIFDLEPKHRNWEVIYSFAERKRNHALFGNIVPYEKIISKKKSSASAFLRGTYDQLWLNTSSMKKGLSSKSTLSQVVEKIKSLNSESVLGSSGADWFQFFNKGLVTQSMPQIGNPPGAQVKAKLREQYLQNSSLLLSIYKH